MKEKLSSLVLILALSLPYCKAQNEQDGQEAAQDQVSPELSKEELKIFDGNLVDKLPENTPYPIIRHTNYTVLGFPLGVLGRDKGRIVIELDQVMYKGHRAHLELIIDGEGYLSEAYRLKHENYDYTERKRLGLDQELVELSQGAIDIFYRLYWKKH